MCYSFCYGSVGPPADHAPWFWSNILFVHFFVCQRNEPKKGHPGQGPQLIFGNPVKVYHSNCARGKNALRFLTLKFCADAG